MEAGKLNSACEVSIWVKGNMIICVMRASLTWPTCCWSNGLHCQPAVCGVQVAEQRLHGDRPGTPDPGPLLLHGSACTSTSFLSGWRPATFKCPLKGMLICGC